MDTHPTIQFDLLTGIREKGNQVGIVQVEMDLTQLDSEPLRTKAAVLPHNATDLWASPLLFKGVPAILSESSSGGSKDGIISIVPYPKRSAQGMYIGWLQPLQTITVPNMNGDYQNWHGIEAMSDNIFFVAYSQPKRDPNAIGGCLDVLDAKGSTLLSDVNLEGAHSVTWDPNSRHIFAVGARELHVYSDQAGLSADGQAAVVLVGVVDFSKLYEGRDMDGRGSMADGGHDLYFMAGERRLFMTTGERCFSVSIDRLLQDLAKESSISKQFKTLVWKHTGDCGIDCSESLFHVKSKFSDDYFEKNPTSKYPRDKVGAKAINRVPGTSVTFVHGYPWYPEDPNYTSNILLVSRGEYDRPSLYDPRPDDTPTNLRMILENKTYRCRVIPRLPKAQIMRVLPVLESATIQFCSWTGGLGKVGFPYLRVTGMDQQIANLFSTLTVPPIMDQDNFVYGYVVIDQDGCQRDAIIRVHQRTETSGACDGMLVGANPKYLVAVFAWATPFVLDWRAKQAIDGNELTVTVETVRPADQRLVSISAWIRMSPLLPGMMVQLSKIDLEKKSFSETIRGSHSFYSIMIFAKSLEGFLYCSGERLIEPWNKVDGVEP